MGFLSLDNNLILEPKLSNLVVSRPSQRLFYVISACLNDKNASLFSPTFHLQKQFVIIKKATNQAIPGNDQIAYPTNQKAAGSKLKRTS